MRTSGGFHYVRARTVEEAMAQLTLNAIVIAGGAVLTPEVAREGHREQQLIHHCFAPAIRQARKKHITETGDTAREIWKLMAAEAGDKAQPNVFGR
jgi:CO/xanthine dehydrogenase FAD-binding subunit